jgi:hypothetical protein
MLVGARSAAQLRDGPRLDPVLLAPDLTAAERDPGDLGQQVGPAVRHVPELGNRGGLVVLVQGAQASVTSGDAGQPGGEEAVTVGSGTILHDGPSRRNSFIRKRRGSAGSGVA